jgi:chromosome segregation ATPase
MFNIKANLPHHRYNLSAISEEMGLGGQRRREEDDAPRSDAGPPVKGTHPRQITGRIDTLAAAQQLAMEQRKAAEALLQQARALEEQIQNETAAAQAARERAQELAALASRAFAAEQEAQERAKAAAERCAAANAQRQKIEAVRSASQLAWEAANTELAELQQRVDQVQRVAQEAAALLRTQEARAAEAAAAAIAAEKEAADAAAQFVRCQAIREAAEREAKASAQQAESFGMDAVRAFTARMNEQSNTLKFIDATTPRR